MAYEYFILKCGSESFKDKINLRKFLLCIHWDQMLLAIYVSAPPLPIQFLLVAWESSAEWSKPLGPHTCVGTKKLVAATWRVIQQMENLSVFPSLFTVFSINMNKSPFP